MSITVPLRMLLTLCALVFSGSVVEARASDDTEGLINKYYSQAVASYSDGNYDLARDFIDKALNIAPENGEYPNVFVLSSMLYMNEGNCSLALKRVQTTLEQLERLAMLVDSKKVDPDKDLGPGEWALLDENYYFATKVYGYCNYQLSQPEKAKRAFSVIEKRWNDKFQLNEMTRLGHSYQLTGNNKEAITYYTLALSEAPETLRDKTLSAEDVTKLVESVRYNIAIAYQELGNLNEAIAYVELLLSESEGPNYWIDKMKRDDDYKNIVKMREIERIFGLYRDKENPEFIE